MYKILILISFVICFFIITTTIFFRFPAPSGEYGVGTFDYFLDDKSRIEPNNLKKTRKLMLRFWYPIDSKSAFPKMPYDNDALENMKEFVIKKGKTPSLFLLGLKYTKIYEQKNEQISSIKNTYPIILISNAWGTMVQHYTWLGEELASQGYIVVGINHPYIASIIKFPDNTIIKSLINDKRRENKENYNKWKREQMELSIQDDKFVLDALEKLNEDNNFPFYKKLDLNNIGIIGHSFAGSLAMLMCLYDKRIKVGIALDSSIKNNDDLLVFQKPFLQLLAQKSHVWQDAEGNQDYEKLIKYAELPGMQMTIMNFKNIGHGAFMDLPILLNQTILTKLLSHFIDVDIDSSSVVAVKAINVSKKEITKFFDKYLKE